MACVKTRKSTAKATVCFAFPLTQTRKVRAISFIGKKPTKSRPHGTTFASRTITPCFGCTGSRDQRRGSLPGARGKNCCWWKASPAGECPKNWPEGRRQKCGTTALSANADAPVGESVCGDLEFYFGADNVGWYEFSIAPEGSDAWVKLDDVCIDRGWSADGYVCPSKYGVRFEEGSGLYQLRATVKAPLPFAISNIWHNLPLQPEGALLYVACPPGTEQWQEAIAATQAVIVTQMEPEGLRE